MSDETSVLLRERRRAGIVGDWGLYRSLTVDLARIGHTDGRGSGLETAGLETAVVDPAPERAVPPRKGGRPKLPRCEHGRIVGRCVDCQDEEAL